jgi:hypothetical protein
MKKKLFIACFLILLVLGVSGCNINLQQMLKSSDAGEEKLIQVEIIFTDGQSLTGYIKTLGIEQEDGRVYVGGSSLNYLYDENGNTVGCYNYQRVLYITILPEETEADEEKNPE